MAKIIKNKKGFVLLFAVTISAIFLAIALGVANIAFREVRFSTNARDTNEALFAADTGVEFMFHWDKIGSFPTPTMPTTNPPIQTWSIPLPGLGSASLNCSFVTITKDNTVSPMTTTIISKGYNLGGDNPSCASSNPNRVEREIDVYY